jgi:hypothetical protein
MNAVPRVIVEANDYTGFVEPSLVVITESKECKSLLVSVIVFVDTSYTRVRFVNKDRLLIEI